jgi:hypothetical protein
MRVTAAFHLEMSGAGEHGQMASVVCAAAEAVALFPYPDGVAILDQTQLSDPIDSDPPGGTTWHMDR